MNKTARTVLEREVAGWRTDAKKLEQAIDTLISQTNDKRAELQALQARIAEIDEALFIPAPPREAKKPQPVLPDPWTQLPS